MAQDNSFMRRPTLLTNSAAEFLETRAAEALGAELVSLNNPQYVPVRDQFMSLRAIPSVDYHTESAQKLKSFEVALEKFARTIRQRGFDRKLDIALKDPKTYSMEDVLSIAEKIEEKHRHADKVKDAMGLIRKCFRCAGDNHGQLSRLLKFVPNDTYGTIISGGFTIILGAVQRAEKIRTDIYEVLADIPMKLREVEDLSELHFRSVELQRRADSVFVAIFVVLERIVDELSKNMAKKGVSLIFKGDRHSFELTEAIDDLGKRLEEFKSQAEICLHQRFGRLDYKMTRTILAAENTEMVAAETGTNVVDIQRRLDRFERRWEESNKIHIRQQDRLAQLGQALLDAKSTEEIEAIRRETLQTNVYNSMYVFLTGNPTFDSRTGTVDQEHMMALQRELAFPLNPRDPTSTWSKRNKKVVNNWLDYLSPVHYVVTEEFRECFHSFGSFSLADKDKVQWLITSDEIHSWLETPQSAVLIVEPQTHPDGVLNPVSFTSAFLAKLLRKQDYPTACFFCGIRSNISMEREKSGPGAMLRSVFAQLLIQIQKKRPGVEMAAFSKPDAKALKLTNVAGYLERIRKLLCILPDHDCVFILLDSVLDLAGSDSENDEAIEGMLKLADDMRLIIKIMATSIFSTAARDHGEYITLFLPDFLHSGGHDINPAFFEGDTLESLEAFETQLQSQEDSIGSLDEESDDEIIDFN